MYAMLYRRGDLMRLKRISLCSMVLMGILSTNVVHGQEDVILEDSTIEVVSIYKTSEATSVKQLREDLKEASNYYKGLVEKRDRIQQKLDELGSRGDNSSVEPTTINIGSVTGTVSSMPLVYNSTTNNSTKVNTSNDVNDLKRQLDVANSDIDDAKDVYVNVLSRYGKVMESITDDDVKSIVSENQAFDKDDFTKTFTSLVEKSREAKRIADEKAKREAAEKAKKEAEEQAKKEAVAKEAARNRQITTVDFAPIDPNFTAAINGGAWGNCTYYVYNRVAQLGKPIPSPSMGHAYMWSNSARSMGYSVSRIPKTGTIAVFSQGVAGSDPTYGHVSFVEKVFSDGSVLVSEMNVQGLNVISTRIISASDAQLTEFIDVGL